MLLRSSRVDKANPSVGLDWALGSIARWFGARAAVLWSCDRESDGWEVAAYFGYDGGLRCPAVEGDECLCRAAAVSGQTLTDAYARTLEATVGRCPYVTDRGLTTFIGSPIAFKEETVGACALFFDATHRIGPAELGSFIDAVEQAGAALANLRTTRAIFSAKTEWETAVDAIAAPVAVLDENMSVRRANRTFAEWVGASWNRIVGRKYSDLAMSYKAPRPGQEVPDNKPFSIRMSTECSAEASRAVCYPRKDAASSVVGTVCMVDTGQKPSVSSQMVAMQRSATLGRLAAELAHELGAPLSTVAGYAELLLAQHLAEPAKEVISVIQQETGRAQGIVRRMLDLGRQQPVRREEVALNDVARAAIRLYAHATTFHRVTLRSELAENLPPVRADFDQLLQVLLNLLANAYRAVQQNEQRREVTVFTRKEGDRIQLGVADTGSGIAPDMVSRVFEPFFTTHTDDEGTGLGLAVSRKIVESHQGSISVDTVQGKGSTFTVDLPGATSESTVPAETSDTQDG